jgi:hypothetical protein
MKSIFLSIALSFLLISCTTDYQESDQSFETLPVSLVEMPTKFAKDSITEIPISYIRPTVCHGFYDFYYLREGMTRTVAVIAFKQNNESCPASQITYTAPLKFKPSETGTYHFKFWTGRTVQGVDQYAEYDAIVNH